MESDASRSDSVSRVDLEDPLLDELGYNECFFGNLGCSLWNVRGTTVYSPVYEVPPSCSPEGAAIGLSQGWPVASLGFRPSRTSTWPRVLCGRERESGGGGSLWSVRPDRHDPLAHILHPWVGHSRRTPQRLVRARLLDCLSRSTTPPRAAHSKTAPDRCDLLFLLCFLRRSQNSDASRVCPSVCICWFLCLWRHSGISRRQSIHLF